MNHTSGVHHSERLGHPLDERHALIHTEWPTRNSCCEVLTLEPLHRQIMPPIFRHTVVDVLGDPWMMKLGQEVRLPPEACDLLFMLVQHDLERDRLAATSVQRSPDCPHAAGARQPLQFKTAYEHLSRACRGRRKRRRVHGLGRREDILRIHEEHDPRFERSRPAATT